MLTGNVRLVEETGSWPLRRRTVQLYVEVRTSMAIMLDGEMTIETHSVWRKAHPDDLPDLRSKDVRIAW